MSQAEAASWKLSRPLLGLRAVLALLALLSVAALLAWVFGLGPFQVWFWAVSLPAMLLLGAAGWWIVRTGRHPRLGAALVAGVLGGVAGTIGYDLFRIPFVAAGLRLFAPIDSYGVLMLGADSSSPWTGLAGWGYHFSNGLGFGVAYAMAALGRRWWWGVVWGMVLETATVITPFVDSYGLRGRWGIIAIAYVAHVAYGAPLGKIVERAGSWSNSRSSPVRAWWVIAALAAGLLIWHRPVITPPEVALGTEVALGPSAVISDTRFQPEWLRVAPGGCAVIRNLDDRAYELPGGAEARPGEDARVCFEGSGVRRVSLGEPYSGGFVIVDRYALRPRLGSP
jgi:hypothetical protein